jgi:hypothetical protein
MPLEGSIIPVGEGVFQEGAANRGMAPDADSQLLATTAAWVISGLRDGGIKLPTGFPPKKWLPRLKRW